MDQVQNTKFNDAVQNILSFQSIFKSIVQFPQISLPSFVVLTGKNGSGKTHLLNAIKGGQIRSSLVQDLNQDVRIFDSMTIVPQDGGLFDPAQDQTRRSNWFGIIRNAQEQNKPGIFDYARNLGIPWRFCSSVKSLYQLTVEQISEFISDPEKAKEIEDSLRGYIRQIGAAIAQNSVNQIADEAWRIAIPRIQQLNPEAFVISSQFEFFRNENFLWGDVDPFQQAFGRVFSVYRELMHTNDRLEKYPPKDGLQNTFLTPEAFVEEYGVPPWEFVNQILEECKLDFRVDSPPLHETSSYEPKLRKQSSSVEMRFQDLSSGERVLMSFALCLYNAREMRQRKSFPKLLLLDEVDAPLHPSMTASLLNTIQNVLVKSKSVSVIMTTHSPSTVALAPENAIYAMNPDGPKVEKISKSYALSLLTTDVPTLSVSFDGRRQVFVESHSDANLYELLYQKYKSTLNSERSLTFIEVGHKDESGGERNAGCVQVTRIVENLSKDGNRSVLGLIDWDGERNATPRIHVLSPNIRNGIESLIFDPTLVAAIVAREHPEFAHEQGILQAGENYAVMGNWCGSRWQTAADTVQRMILGVEVDWSKSMVVEYLSNIKIKVMLAYLHMDDHELENKVISKFGFLKPKNKHAGGLMRHVANTVLTEFPALIPKDLLSTFNGLLCVDI